MTIAVIVYAGLGIRLKKVIDISSNSQNTQGRSGIGELLKSREIEFNLILNYRDPFLGQTISIPSNHLPSTVKDINRQKLPKKTNTVMTSFSEPDFTLIGTINKVDKSKSLCIVALKNKKEQVYQINDTIQSFTISNVYKDSIKITYKNITRILKICRKYYY